MGALKQYQGREIHAIGIIKLSHLDHLVTGKCSSNAFYIYGIYVCACFWHSTMVRNIIWYKRGKFHMIINAIEVIEDKK